MTSFDYSYENPTPGIATLNFFESTLSYNNLGGMGPAFDDPHELRFNDLGKTPSGDFAVDLRITNMSTYTAFKSENNGVAGQFANINILGNTNVMYEFCFLYSARRRHPPPAPTGPRPSTPPAAPPAPAASSPSQT